MPVTISLCLDEETANRLEILARTTDRSKSNLIREAIEQYVAEYADYQIELDRSNDIHDEVISSRQMKELLVNKEQPQKILSFTIPED